MARYLPLILLALAIDGLQALFSAGFMALAGGITAIPVVGQVSSVVTIPLAIGLGFVTDICLSLTFGSGLLFLLAVNRMFYINYAFGGGVAEIIPGLDVLPGWTLMTVLCVLRKTKKQGKLEGKASTAFATMLLPKTPAGFAFRTIKTVNQSRVDTLRESGYVSADDEKETRVSSRQQLKANLQDIDGIKPVQGTRPRTTYAA